MMAEALDHRAKDLTAQVAVAGTYIVGANPTREWMAFVNQGTGYIDVMWINEPGAVVAGRIRLYPGGTVVFSKTGDMPWDGPISATAEIALDTLGGVEVSAVP